MRKRSIRKLEAAVRRQEKQRAKARAVWAKQEQRLVECIQAVKDNKTMQVQTWVDGQVAYFEKLLANHRAAKPK